MTVRKSLLKNCPPEWNVRVLTRDDFYSHCDAGGIQLHEDVQIEQPGLYMVYDGRPHIFIDERLRGAERLFVQFHELAHYWIHPSGIKFFLGWERSIEQEANIIAACALIPRTVLEHYWPAELVELYGYSNKLIETRRAILERWKI